MRGEDDRLIERLEAEVERLTVENARLMAERDRLVREIRGRAAEARP
jgi:hypothetical protein